MTPNPPDSSGNSSSSSSSSSSNNKQRSYYPSRSFVSTSSSTSDLGVISEDGSQQQQHAILETGSEIVQSVTKEHWHSEGLTVIVIGASGDLAKKKTYPSLLDLYANGLLPPQTEIHGYARSAKTHEGLREHLKPYLLNKCNYEETFIDDFLQCCYYHSGKSYGDFHAYYEMMNMIRQQHECAGEQQRQKYNRLFYLAIPPNVFGDTAIAIRKTSMQTPSKGWSRIIIEKPFGHDLQSCQELQGVLEQQQFGEHHLYRIDHYLGKEMVQNLLVWRFGNSWWEYMWHRNAIQSIHITFKEPFGTEGRGGYFDNFGIIRDVLQNHLLQVLTLLTMEPPLDIDNNSSAAGGGGGVPGDAIRDSKVQVLRAIPPITLQDTLLGQYEGYADDETIENKDTNCPTYAMMKLSIQTSRWIGVPIILEAGKALDERTCEISVKLHPPPTLGNIFSETSYQALKKQPNELIMKLQPNPSIYMKTNIKTPGFSAVPTMGVLGMDYSNMNNDGAAKKNTTTPGSTPPNNSNPDAYTRLILDVLRGRQGSFVRNDELERSWEIFTPLLHEIEEKMTEIRPHSYKYGSNGPPQRQAFLQSVLGESEYEVDKPNNTTTTTTRLDGNMVSSL